MKIYGYSRDKNLEETVLEMSEITLQGDSGELKKVADYILHVARLIDEHGDQFGHEHIKNHLRDKWNGPDIVICK